MARRGNKLVFRRSLQELSQETNTDVPVIFKESIEILKQRGLEVKGLFLSNADNRKVRLLERAWDQGQNPLRLAKVQDCHAVAASLLLWLRSLPDPVIPCKLFRAFLRLQHCTSQAESLTQLHYLFTQMDTCELQILSQLLEFLHAYQMTQHKLGSFISPSLGQIFAPVLLRAQTGPLPLPYPEDVRAAAMLVDNMITDCPAIFSHPPPCCNTAHKPPCRAKKNRGLLRNQLASATPAVVEASGSPAIGKFAAKAPRQQAWPGKHLRVVVVPPFEDAEVCFMEADCHEVPQWPAQEPFHSLHSDSQGGYSPFREHSRLATVPEGKPLASDPAPQDPELDNLVGALMCGSMESLLFGGEDAMALGRTGSTLSCPCSSGCNLSHSGESTDLSSDDDFLEATDSPMSSPIKIRHPSKSSGMFCDSSDFQTWLTSAR